MPARTGGGGGAPPPDPYAQPANSIPGSTYVPPDQAPAPQSAPATAPTNYQPGSTYIPPQDAYIGQPYYSDAALPDDMTYQGQAPPQPTPYKPPPAPAPSFFDPSYGLTQTTRVRAPQPPPRRSPWDALGEAVGLVSPPPPAPATAPWNQFPAIPAAAQTSARSAPPSPVVIDPVRKAWLDAAMRTTSRWAAGVPVSGFRDIPPQWVHPVERNSPGYPAQNPAPGTIPQMLGGRVYPITQAHTEEEQRSAAAIDGEGYDYHTGTDIGVPAGVPIFMPGNQGGVVLSATDDMSPAVRAQADPYGVPDNSGGLRILLDDGTTMVIAHTSSLDVTPGQRLNPGDRIGVSGSVMDVGRHNGEPGHVHIGLIRTDPYGRTIDAVDPVTYFRSQRWYETAPKTSIWGDWEVGQRDFETIDPGDYSYRYPRYRGRR